MDTPSSRKKASDYAETERNPSFGEWMRRRRKALDLTQDELARRSGCAKTTIRKLEAGELKPSKELASALAEQLDVPAEERDSLVRFARGAAAADKLPSARVDDLPWRAPTRRSNNLPRQLTAFVGRQREVSEVKRLLTSPTKLVASSQERRREMQRSDESRLVTLTGSGGCGKTRLALQVAEELPSEFPLGMWFVDLAPLGDPTRVVQRVASAVDVLEEPHRPVLEVLTDVLSRGKSLLILDNCEHVVAACAQLAEVLLRSCVDLKILATSREAFGIGGETSYQVPPLALPPASALQSPTPDLERYEAVQLFLDRVRAVNAGFQIDDENGPAIAHICIRLDGLPLALELAAARTKQLTMEDISERLDDRFTLLTTGSRTSLPRQQTLRAAIDWSFDLLAEEERVLFRRICVFVGGFTLEATEVVCSGDAVAQDKTLDRLSQLIAKSLVTADTQHGLEARYGLLETVRQYGLEKLREAAEAETIQRRHLNFFLKLAEQAEPKLQGDEQLAWLKKLEEENDNLRAALAWSRASETAPEVGLRLAGALWRFWWLRGRLSEGRGWLADMLSRGESGRTYRAKALMGGGNLAYYQGDYEAAGASYREGLAIVQRIGDKQGAGNLLNGLGNVAFSQGDFVAARKYYEASLPIRRDLRDEWSVANSLCNLAGLEQSEGDYASARSLLEECLPINKKLGDRRGVAFVLNNLGNVILAQGDRDRARSLQEESLASYRVLGDEWGVAYALDSLGDCEQSQGNYPPAYLHYQESLKLRVALKDKNGIIHSLDGIALIAAQVKQPERSVRLLAAAQSLRNEIGLIRPHSELARYERYLADLRLQIGEKSFGALWAEGNAMTMGQACDYALVRKDKL